MLSPEHAHNQCYAVKLHIRDFVYLRESVKGSECFTVFQPLSPFLFLYLFIDLPRDEGGSCGIRMDLVGEVFFHVAGGCVEIDDGQALFRRHLADDGDDAVGDDAVVDAPLYGIGFGRIAEDDLRMGG